MNYKLTQWHNRALSWVASSRQVEPSGGRRAWCSWSWWTAQTALESLMTECLERVDVSGCGGWDTPASTCSEPFCRRLCSSFGSNKGKGSPFSITERRVPELIPVLGSQPAGDVSHKPGCRLPLLSARLAVTNATLKRAATNFAGWWTEAHIRFFSLLLLFSTVSIPLCRLILLM